MLSDGDHVRNLLGRYCERLDAGDLTAVGALFAHGRLAPEADQVGSGGAVAAGPGGISQRAAAPPTTSSEATSRGMAENP